VVNTVDQHILDISFIAEQLTPINFT